MRRLSRISLPAPYVALSPSGSGLLNNSYMEAGVRARVIGKDAFAERSLSLNVKFKKVELSDVVEAKGDGKNEVVSIG